MKTFFTALRLFVLLTLLTGGLYPLLVTAIGHTVFPSQSQGSLVARPDGSIIGSSLLAQRSSTREYFWSRPSAGDYATLPSAASHLAATSARLRESVRDRASALRVAHGLDDHAPVPSDLLYTSGSGLDPHLSPEAAFFQVARIAQARQCPSDSIVQLVREHLQPGGVLGEARVNVLELNLALDHLAPFPKPATQAPN